MHLGIDIREVCSAHPTGKAVWSAGLLAELLTRDLKFTLFTDRELPVWLHAVVQKMELSVVTLPHAGLRWHWEVSRMLLHMRMDVYLSPTSFIVPFLVGTKIKVIPVIHDLIAFRRERHDRKARLIERLTLPRALRYAWKVCTVSEATRNDLMTRFPHIAPQKIIPILAGASDAPVLQSESDDRTIVCIGTLSPRKNQLRLIKAFAALPSPFREGSRLLLIGNRGWADEDIVKLAKETSGVEWRGYVSNKDCDVILHRAAIFAFPSLYEGFGLPLLDAMKRGIPLLISDRGSLREVAGDAALYCDPEDTASITAGLMQLLSKPALCNQLIELGKKRVTHFTWEKTVDRLLQALA